jgi:cysteine desulfuration protein SufE
MPSPIDIELDDLADEFELIGEPNDPERYRHLMDMGRRLEPLSEVERSDANKVRGCTSQVWLITEPQADRSVRFRGDSDSDIVRGLVAVLIRLYSGRKPEDVLDFDIKGAFDRLGFSGAISAQRSNGFFSMVQRVRRDAEALAGA